MAFGVFGLRKIYLKQVKNITDNNFASWPETASYGYYGGGYVGPPGVTNSIVRYDFSNENFSFPGKNLSAAKSRGASAYSSLYGYFYSGSPGSGGVSNIERLDFSTENISASTNNAPFGSRIFSGVSTNYYAYFAGGFTPGTTSKITRLDFSNEIVSEPGNNLPVASTTTSVFSDFYGYFSLGRSFSTIARIDFSNETVSNPGKNFPSPKDSCPGTASKENGYFGGGYTSPPATSYNSITKLNFSSETISTIPAALSTLRANSETVKNSSYGYFTAGFISPPYSYVSNVSRLDFSTELTASPGRNYPSNNNGLYGFSGGASVSKQVKTYGAGYVGGGALGPVPGSSSTITRLDFSNETASNPGKNLPTAYNAQAATASVHYGYFCGGYSPITQSVVIRLDFSTENVSLPGKNLPTQQYRFAAFSSNSYGYFGGGYAGAPFYIQNTISRLDFSNEIVSNPGKTLIERRGSHAAIASNSYGYFGGGVDPNFSCKITRLDFSNETISNPGNNLAYAATDCGSVQTNFYGYFSGGRNPVVSTVSRLDFSNDTISQPGKNLPTIRLYHSGNLSNNQNGYFIGGNTGNSPVTAYSSFARIDFSSETVTNMTTGSLPSTRLWAAAVSNSN